MAETVEMAKTVNMTETVKMADYNEYESSLDYREAIGLLSLPWLPQYYLEPREKGMTATDVTSFMPGQQWSLENLPNILYYIEPPVGWFEYKKKAVDFKRDASGNLVMERWPRPGQPARPLRNFRALPDQIGTMEHPIYIAAWRKLEPGATWDDFLMRMEYVPSTPIHGNTLSMRISRIADDYWIIFTWHGTKDLVKPSESQLKRLALVSAEARANNTVRGLAPGLIDPSKGEKGGRIPVPDLKGNCEGRGQTWHSRYGLEKAPRRARTKRNRSTRRLTTAVDESDPIEVDDIEEQSYPELEIAAVDESDPIEVDDTGEQSYPELEIDYIAKALEAYHNGVDLENESAMTDGLYPATEFGYAFQHHEGLADLASADYLSDQMSLADATYFATLNHGEPMDLTSSGGHSNTCDQRYPTIATDHTPQQFQQATHIESSDGQSYTSSDMMFPDQDYQSSSSSVILDDQHVQAHRLKAPIELHQQYANSAGDAVQAYSMKGIVFQDKVPLPIMAPSDIDFPLDPRLQMLDNQRASGSLLCHVLHESDFPMIDNEDLAAPVIGSKAQPQGPNASLRAFGSPPGPPATGFEAQLFDPNIASFGDHPAAPVGLQTEPFEPNADFEPFDSRPVTTFEDSVVHHEYETRSNFRSSDNQSASSFEGYTHPQNYEPQSSFSSFDNQRFRAPNLSVAETPSDPDLMEQNFKDNASAFEEPINHQEGSRFGFEDSMFDHEDSR